MRITMTDVTLAGHCAKGARAWFKTHGLDFRSFLKDGIDADTFVANGDHLAVRVVEMKSKREAGRG